MVKLSRRLFLRGGAAATGAAVVADLGQKAAAHGTPSFVARWLQEGQAGMPATAEHPENFTDFVAWWNKYGRESAEKQARDIFAFDPDILTMVSVSLSAKTRMQRERNFARLKEEKQRDFFRRLLRDKVFRWWP